MLSPATILFSIFFDSGLPNSNVEYSDVVTPNLLATFSILNSSSLE
jgi:hypothetical protein